MTNDNCVKKLLNLVKQILANEIDIVSASRTISSIRFDLQNYAEEELLKVFISIDSDTDSYPTAPLERKLWDQVALSEFDDKIRLYLDEVKPYVYDACKKIIAKYDPNEGPLK